MPRNRWGFLRSAVATTLGPGIARCTGTSDESSEPASTTSTSTTAPSTETAAQEAATTATTTTTTVAGPIDHPSAVGIEDEPMLGGKPWETDAALIMFSDPSCPYCGMFEQNVFPELKQKLIDPGTVSYVYRTYPSVEPWVNGRFRLWNPCTAGTRTSSGRSETTTTTIPASRCSPNARRGASSRSTATSTSMRSSRT